LAQGTAQDPQAKATQLDIELTYSASTKQSSMQSFYNTFSPGGRSQAEDSPGVLVLSQTDVGGSLEEKKGQDDKGKFQGASDGEGKLQGASVASVTSNLWNTTMGGGISLLALPSAAQSGGLALFPVVVILVGIVAAYSADLLVLGSLKTRATDYTSFIRAGLGRGWSHLADLLIFAYLLGVNASLAEATKSAISPVLTIPVVICALLAVLYSLVMSLTLPNMDAIAPFSQAAFFLTLAFICYMSVESANDLSQHFQSAAVHWWPSSPMGFFNAVSQVTYAWLFHFNVLPIFDEMREPKRQGWFIALPLSIFICVFCFLAAGILSALTHPTSTQTVFVQYAAPMLGKILSFGFGVGFVISMPLYQWVGTRSLFSLCSACTPAHEVGEADTESLATLSETQPASQGLSLKVMQYVFAALTFLFIMLVKKLDNVITLISAVSAVPMMFILPPLAWASIRNAEKAVLTQRAEEPFLHSVPVAYAVATLGTILWMGCLYSLGELHW